MNRPEFGKFYTINGKAKKRRVILKQSDVPPVKPHYIEHAWGNVRHDVWSLWTRWKKTPCKAMYIGFRTLYDGKIEYMGEDYGNAFFAERHHEAWLFVIDERTNPIYVFPEDVDFERSNAAQSGADSTQTGTT